MCDDLNARMINKRGAGVPTIPVSSDHRNGDWIATDIYEGEQYQDTNTGLVYTRNGNDITTSSGKTPVLIWKALIIQSTTNPPVLTELINNIGVTAVSNYGVVGSYTITGFAGLITGNYEIVANFNQTVGNEKYVTAATSSVIGINTYAAGVAADDCIEAGSSISVLLYV